LKGKKKKKENETETDFLKNQGTKILRFEKYENQREFLMLFLKLPSISLVFSLQSLSFNLQPFSFNFVIA